MFQFRDGADDETARRAVESNGKEDHLVGSSRDHRGDRSDDAALERAISRRGLQRASGSTQREGETSEWLSQEDAAEIFKKPATFFHCRFTIGVCVTGMGEARLVRAAK